jgi:NAD(P)-dependent dehydrogenase (short-subunit alcohol dehydrogenase family)
MRALSWPPPDRPPQRDVLVVVGAGGMGAAIADRLGPGRTVLLADVDPVALELAARRLADGGHDVVAQHCDVADEADVRQLARVAADLGPVRQVAHTAGVSPETATVAEILRVDLLGTAWVLEAFGAVVAPGGAGVVVASMAGHLATHAVTADQELALAVVPPGELLGMSCTQVPVFADPTTAYGFAKRASAIRVRAAALQWAKRGARVNSISPGIVATPMAFRELDGRYGPMVAKLVADAPAGRIGTPHDVAHAAAFLLDAGSSYVTGIDLLVDGGTMAAIRTGS